MSSLDDLFNEAAQVQAQIQANPPAASRPALQPPQDLSLMDRLLAKVPTGLVNNQGVDVARRVTTAAAAPETGTAQLLANAAAALRVPGASSVASSVNSGVDSVNAQNDSAGASLPPAVRVGSDFVGSAIAPTNLLLASWLKPATSLAGAAIQGAKIGAAQGLSAPVENGNESFWMPKVGRTVASTALGAIAQPVLTAASDKVATYIAKYGADPKNAAAQADEMLKAALSDSGQTLDSVPPAQLASVRADIQNAIANGKRLDAAAALRKADFDAEGIAPTQGQITRDPQQWAEEQTVKGVIGLGAPLNQTMAAGNKAVTKGIGAYGANAQEPAVASQGLASALRGYGASQQGSVTSAYNAARASTGKDLDVPLTGLAQDYANALDTFGDKVPSAVQAKFRALGLDPAQPSNQQKVFTFQNADDLRHVINAHVGSDPVTNKALGAIRTALDRAQTNVDASGGPFAPAVQAARTWFDQQRAVPALGDAIGGPVDDRFVKQAIISNPSTPDVQKLAALLREQAPDQFEAVRQQIGQHLTNSAFGTNVAGDTQVAQASYNKALQQLGSGKLEAFFSPHEVDQMRRLGRIASYQVGTPAEATANFSNTASAIANLLRNFGGHLPIAGKSVQLLGDKMAGNAALNVTVPVTPNLSDAQRLMLARALSGVTGAGTSAALGSVSQ